MDLDSGDRGGPRGRTRSTRTASSTTRRPSSAFVTVARQGREREARRVRGAPARHGEEPSDPRRAQELQPEVRVADPGRPGESARRATRGKGVQTSAFNLPNDEQVVRGQGFQEGALKNVMEAKFRAERPADRRARPRACAAKGRISFDAYFNDTLFHELSHGLGRASSPAPTGRRWRPGFFSRTLYSTIEECKADVVGIWNILFGDGEEVADGIRRRIALRDLRRADVPLDALRRGRGARRRHRGPVELVPGEEGDRAGAGRAVPRQRASSSAEAIRSLSAELLEIEATGTSSAPSKLLDRYGKVTPEIRSTIARLTDIPVDIEPVFAAAGEK